MEKWSRAKYSPAIPLGEDGKRITGCQKHIDLSHKAACEGIVLLKNSDNVLPINNGKKIAVFGKGQYDYIKGGGGSGDVTVAYVRNIYDALKIKEEEGKVQLFDGLIDYYKREMDEQYKHTTWNTWTKEPELPEDALMKAAEFTDTAIITISRFSCEGWDRSGVKYDGDFYLDQAEEKMVNAVKENFKNIIVIINAGAQTDTEWYHNDDRIQSVLYAWQGGMEGGLAIADILCGDENPSGKLVDTFAKSFDSYPSADTFNASEDYVKYYEDIYVGYRYFETIPEAEKQVNYPFGFGLSYTEFKIDNINADECEDKIKITADVTNIGKISGKEVVQVYYNAPQGKLGKPKYQLSAFRKTKELAPGETEKVSMEFDISFMSSFDDVGKVCESAYVLEKGEYKFFVGNSIRNTVKADFEYILNDDVVVEKLSHRCPPNRLERRMLSDGSFEELKQINPDGKKMQMPEFNAEAPKEKMMLIDVVNGKCTLDEFIVQLSLEDMIELTCGKPCKGVANTCGMGGLEKFGVPSVMTADGPAGCRIMLNCTAFPCATMLACTWNPDLVYEVGVCGALEVKENNLSVWLTPALNIHRNPLCGRNFEYYSEDPLISGIMAAAKVNGIQSQNISASVKHFCANNKEINRNDSDSIVSERALREIYLKGFEICVKQSNPWTIMSSYNLLNGKRTSENYDLLTGILRMEWGFDGVVTTDWDNNANQYCELRAGNDIRMPVGSPEYVCSKTVYNPLPESKLSAKRILEFIMKFD